MESIEKVKTLMKELGIIGEIIYHEKSGKTTGEAEAALGVSKKHILKVLLLKYKNKTIAAIITGDKRLNFRKIEKVSKLKKLRLASAEEVREFTGFKIGGIPPFIFHKLCPTYVDKEVMKQDYVIGAAGTEYAGVKFSPNEFRKIGYIIEEIT